MFLLFLHQRGASAMGVLIGQVELVDRICISNAGKAWQASCRRVHIDFCVKLAFCTDVRKSEWSTCHSIRCMAELC